MSILVSESSELPPEGVYVVGVIVVDHEMVVNDSEFVCSFVTVFVTVSLSVTVSFSVTVSVTSLTFL